MCTFIIVAFTNHLRPSAPVRCSSRHRRRRRPFDGPAAAPAAVFFDAVAAVAAIRLAGRRPGRRAGGPEAAAPQPTPPQPDDISSG